MGDAVYALYNDNDKRLGLTAKADQPDHKKIQYTKNKFDSITAVSVLLHRPSAGTMYIRGTMRQ